MKSTNIRTAAAAGAVFAALTVATTAIAHADAKDVAFIASLTKLGMKVEDPSMARSMGLLICGDLASGRTPDQIAQDFEQNGPAIIAAGSRLTAHKGALLLGFQRPLAFDRGRNQLAATVRFFGADTYK